MSYESDLGKLAQQLFNVEQLRKEFEAKHNVIIQDLDLTPGEIVPNNAADSNFDSNGYHRTLNISRPDAYGFVTFKAVDQAITAAIAQFPALASRIKKFPRFVNSVEALVQLKLFDQLNDMTRAVSANASYVQFLGGWTGQLAKNRATIFAASFAHTNPETLRTDLTAVRRDACGFAASQVSPTGKITWQGPTLEEQEKALLKIFNEYVNGKKLNELIYTWIDLDASTSSDFI